VGKAVFSSASRLWTHDPPEWKRSIFRVWDALARTCRFTQKAASELRASERLLATHPECARQHLRLASQAVRKADAQRERVCVYLIAAGSPGAYERCEEPLVQDAAFHAFERGMENGAELDAVSERLNRALADLPGTSGIDDRRPHLPGGARLPRRFLTRGLLSAADRIRALFKRRQRFCAAAPEDAPRRVSRGRAPPSFAVCSI
jgi:hypothetical protein